MTQYVVRYFSLSYFAMINKESVTMAGVASVEINFNLLRVVQILQTKLTSCFLSSAQIWLLSVFVDCWRPLTEGRDVCYKTEIFPAQLGTTAETQLITRTPHACSELCSLWCKNIR